MKQIAIIPARSGSKGVRDKNIRELCNKPLMQYSIDAAKQAKVFDCVHVSTDSSQYADIAIRGGAEVPFLRPEELGADETDTWSVVRNVIEQYQCKGEHFDIITLLQPTSPLRKTQDILNAQKLFAEKSADSVISVCEVEHAPQLINTIGDDLCMSGFLDMTKSGRRQDMGKYYRINGAIYMFRTELLSHIYDLYGDKSYAYIMPQERSVDIDTELDFKIAETIMSNSQYVE